MDVKRYLGKSWVIKTFLLMTLFFMLITACNSLEIKPNHTSMNRAATGTECRDIEHALGKTCIPLKPQRIIVLEPWLLDILFALGIKESIVGTSCYNNLTWVKQECVVLGLSSDQLEYLKNIEKLGANYAPSLEKILFLEPDFILGFDYREPIYKQLSNIAPTVLISSDDLFSFKTNIQRIAQIFEREEVAKEILVEYQDRIAELQKKLGVRLKNAEVSVLIYGCGGDNGFSMPTRQAIWFRILDDLGIKVKPIFSINQEDWCVPFSIETINNYDSDILFIANFQSESGDFLLERPLIASLNAVKNKRAYVIDGQDVWDVYGPSGVNRLLDLLSKHLLEAAQTF